MDTTILATLITAFVTIAGWILTNYILRKKEDRTKRLQIRLDHTKIQIEELYGPLYSLVNQVFTYWDVKERLESHPLTDQEKERIEMLFRDRYFNSIHQEIKALLKTKFHLIEGVEFPKSYWDYLQHTTQETVQTDIWKELNISTSELKGYRWPKNFNLDVKKQLDLLMNRYENILKELN
jgi:hypothetical protein